MLCAATLCLAQHSPSPADDPLCQDCYTTNYNKALKLMDQRQYSQAKDFFLQALNCPDIPPQSDALSRYNKCISLIRTMKENGEEEGSVSSSSSTTTQRPRSTASNRSQGTSASANRKKDREQENLQNEEEEQDNRISTRTISSQEEEQPQVQTNPPARNNSEDEGSPEQAPSTPRTQRSRADDVPAAPARHFEPEADATDPDATLAVNDYTSLFWRFTPFGGAETFKVRSGERWRVGKVPQWLMTMPNQDAGNFKLICAVNEGDERTAEVKVTNGTDEVVITVHQVSSAGNTLSDRLWEEPFKKCCEHVTDNGRRGDYQGQLAESTDNSSVLIRQGMGMLAWKDGTVYMGEFNNNVEDGYGMKILPAGFEEVNAPNAMYVVGDWRDRSKEGLVNCYDRYGYLVYRGTFSDDLPTGRYPINRDATEYRLVMETLADGSTYLGETVRGEWEGFGALMDPDGNMWIGTWSRGKKNGKGALLQNDQAATVTVGIWRNNNLVDL